MKKLICGLSCALLFGCAAMPTIISGISLANSVIPIIDSFYDTVVSYKLNPNKLQAATIILQQADQIAQQVQIAQATQAELEELKAQAQLLANQANQL